MSSLKYWYHIATDCYEEGEEIYTMYFNESGIFGGHGIQVSWTLDESPIAPNVSIVG